VFVLDLADPSLQLSVPSPTQLSIVINNSVWTPVNSTSVVVIVPAGFSGVSSSLWYRDLDLHVLQTHCFVGW
jgi:hypothetical protein